MPKGRISSHQQTWINALCDAAERDDHEADRRRFEVHVWRPEDWDWILKLLSYESG